MKKIGMLLMLLVSLATANAKCDFSKVKFEKYNQRGNEMYFRTNIDEDSCIYFFFTVYDYQLKRVDTLQAFGSVTGVVFNAKGKYQVRLNVIDECNVCAAVFPIEINITIFGGVFVDAKPSTKDCKAYSFTLKDFNDTCMEYYYSVWEADPWMNKLTDAQFEKLSDSALYFGYSFDDTKYLLDYNLKSQRTFNIQFKDSGRYFVLATWLNKCTGIDTFMFKKIDVCKPVNTTSVVLFNKPEPKLIGMYDIMGRPVYNIKEDELVIYLYSDGSTQRIIRK